jgi:uncharacterized protein YsxB (DUF464 family)
MIKITIYKDSDKYRGFSCLGHAEYADRGEDIICAGVSALVINTINSIEALTDDFFEVDSNEEQGLIECRFVSEISSETVLLMNSLVLGLERTLDDYKDYLELKFEEV